MIKCRKATIHGRRLALSGGTVTLRIYRNPLWKSDRKEGNAMDVFQFMQIVGFALAFFVAGYTLGKRK